MQPRRPDMPEPGCFAIRLVRKGPLVAARVSFQEGCWCVEIDGRETRGPTAGPWEDPAMERVALYGRPITPEEYAFMLARAAHARQHAPGHPAAKPDEPIDFLNLPSPF